MFSQCFKDASRPFPSLFDVAQTPKSQSVQDYETTSAVRQGTWMAMFNGNYTI